MRKQMIQWTGIAVLGMLACTGNAVAADAATVATPAAKTAEAKQELHLTGTFFWSSKKNDVRNIKITLTPKVANEYDAVYEFKWGNQEKTWKGTVTGDLTHGTVSGTALHDDGVRTFAFTGTVTTNGVIACKHSETTKKRTGPTGEMTLKLVP